MEHVEDLIYKKKVKKTKRLCKQELKNCLSLIKTNKMKGRLEYSIGLKYEKYWVDILYYMIKKIRKYGYTVYYQQPNHLIILWSVEFPTSKEKKIAFLAHEHALCKKKLKQ